MHEPVAADRGSGLRTDPDTLNRHRVSIDQGVHLATEQRFHMSIPPATSHRADPPGAAPENVAPSRVGAAILMVLGVILLFPGAWAFIVMVGFLIAGELDLNEAMGHVIVAFWGVCYLIALGGILMIRAARRRLRAANT